MYNSGMFQAQGELLVEHMQNTGEVVLASSSPEGQTLIRNEIRALTESFHTLFNGESYTSALTPRLPHCLFSKGQKAQHSRKSTQLIVQPTVSCEREVRKEGGSASNKIFQNDLFTYLWRSPGKGFHIKVIHRQGSSSSSD